MQQTNTKPFITTSELVEALMIISETAKTLALEVMLIPNESKGGELNGSGTNNPQ